MKLIKLLVFLLVFAVAALACSSDWQEVSPVFAGIDFDFAATCDLPHNTRAASDIWYFGKDRYHFHGGLPLDIFLLSENGVLEFAAINRGCSIPDEVFGIMYPQLAELRKYEVFPEKYVFYSDDFVEKHGMTRESVRHGGVDYERGLKLRNEFWDADIYFEWIASQLPDIDIGRLKEILDEYNIPRAIRRLVILKAE